MSYRYYYQLNNPYKMFEIVYSIHDKYCYKKLITTIFCALIQSDLNIIWNRKTIMTYIRLSTYEENENKRAVLAWVK